MAYCRYCGKAIEEHANFCPYCGAATRGVSSPPPVIPYSPPQDRHVLVIVVIVVAIVIILPMLLSAVMYIMVTGDGIEQIPTAVLTNQRASADTLNITVLAITNGVALTSVVVEMEAPSEQLSMNVGYGLSSTSSISQTGGSSYWLTYNDTNGDLMLSAGDQMTIRSLSGPLDEGTYSITLRHAPTMMTIGHIDALVA